MSLACLSTGSILLDFLHVNDLGEACMFPLEHWQLGPEKQQFLNVFTGVDLTIGDPAKSVASATDFRAEI